MAFALGLLVIVLSVIYLQERNKETRLVREQSQHRIDLAHEIISREVDRVSADLLFVSRIPQLNENQSGIEFHGDVASVFCEFVEQQKVYSQVRLIDRRGHEKVRVDWNGNSARITEPDGLQDKSERYYVKEALQLRPGQIFISDFDLNLENGKLERPLKPVIRFVTPLRRGDRAGQLLVFNYQGQSMLEQLKSIALPGNGYLVRFDGEFLLGPSPDLEWGWLLERPEESPPTQIESVFPGVSYSDLCKEGVLATRDGRFLGAKIEFNDDAKIVRKNQQSLYFVSHIPQDESYRGSRQLLNRLLIVGGIMLVPLALITRFWALAIDRREEQNRKIAQSEKRLRQLSATLIEIQEQERRNISREIHDSLGQQATAINLDLKLLRDKPELETTAAIDRLVSESESLLKSLHGFAVRVRPAELDDLGLIEALQSHIWQFESRTGIECDFHTGPGTVNLGAQIEQSIFRLVQESLNNIDKHADAGIASIRLEIREQPEKQLFLQIVDDGIGIQEESQTENRGIGNERLGIVGMNERVDLLNGKMKVTSKENTGTTVRIWIPLDIDEIENRP